MVEQLTPAYQTFSQYRLGFRTPLIIESGETSGRVYSIDQRINGQSLESWLSETADDQRGSVLDQYMQVAGTLRQLPIPAPAFARLFGDQPRRFDSFAALAEDQLRTAAELTAHRLGEDLPPGSVDRVVAELSRRECRPALVHGDYFPGNVMVGDRQGAMIITGVVDFSPHTLAADPLLDVAGAIWLIGLSAQPHAIEDQQFCYHRALALYGATEPDLAYWLDVYRRYYAIYYSSDPAVFPYAVQQLEEPADPRPR